MSACCCRRGNTFTVSVSTCLGERMASRVVNELKPCFLLMSSGQGRPRTVRFFISYWNTSEKNSLWLRSDPPKSIPGVASESPIIDAFFPRTEGRKFLNLYFHWSSGG